MTAYHFPKHFFWGAATSAHQVEGGNRFNDWWRFEQEPGAILDGTTSGDACRHWELFDQDFAFAAQDGHNAHRFSLEWSRIEPEHGRIDPAAVAHYHEVLASLSRHALKPFVTLHHFTLPLWVADRGGWENRDTIDRFADFAAFCAREYGGEVDWWCTVNEPEVYAFRAYSEAVWPPRRHDDSAALAVMANLLEAHGRAYRALKELDTRDADGDGRASMVGYAKHWVPLEPLRTWFPLDTLRATIEHGVFNRAVAAAPVTGRIDFAIPGARPVRRVVPELEKSLDYVGLNYYTRWKVDSLGRVPHVVPRGARVTDLGWELHAPGFEAAIRDLGAGGTPVVVTENGFADASDTIRPQAMCNYLYWMDQAIQRGVSVLGYFHWSLMDNFEWAEGFRPRFGLYAVDFADPERRRTRRRSADLFARIARANAVTDDVIADVYPDRW